MERLILPAIFFADEDTHHLRFAFHLEVTRRDGFLRIRYLRRFGDCGLLHLDQAAAGQLFQLAEKGSRLFRGRR
jgi:hypothetical protein